MLLHKNIIKILIGTRYPELDPNSLRYTVHLDERPGHEANVRINVSWERPQGTLDDKKVIITYCNNPMSSLNFVYCSRSCQHCVSVG